MVFSQKLKFGFGLYIFTFSNFNCVNLIEDKIFCEYKSEKLIIALNDHYVIYGLVFKTFFVDALVRRFFCQISVIQYLKIKIVNDILNLYI
jgi:hypothetical protein